MLIPDPRQFLRRRDRLQPRRKFRKRKNGIPDEICRLGRVSDLGFLDQRREKGLFAKTFVSGVRLGTQRVGGVRVGAVHVDGAWLVSSQIGFVVRKKIHVIIIDYNQREPEIPASVFDYNRL
jgi:hypothetical protein